MDKPKSTTELFDNHIKRGLENEAEALLVQHPGLWDTYDIVQGDTPFHMLVEYLITSRCTWALEHGASIEVRNKDGMTPLHTASNMDDGDMVDFLIEKGADIEARDNSGATPLLYACAMGCEMAMEHLIAAGADTSAVNNAGMSMLGCFLSGSFYHDWDQAAAAAEWLETYYSSPERVDSAVVEIQRIKNRKDNGKSMFPGLVANIEASKLRADQADIVAKSTPSRRF